MYGGDLKVTVLYTLTACLPPGMFDAVTNYARKLLNRTSSTNLRNIAASLEDHIQQRIDEEGEEAEAAAEEAAELQHRPSRGRAPSRRFSNNSRGSSGSPDGRSPVSRSPTSHTMASYNPSGRNSVEPGGKEPQQQMNVPHFLGDGTVTIVRRQLAGAGGGSSMAGAKSVTIRGAGEHVARAGSVLGSRASGVAKGTQASGLGGHGGNSGYMVMHVTAGNAAAENLGTAGGSSHMLPQIAHPYSGTSGAGSSAASSPVPAKLPSLVNKTSSGSS